MGFPNSAAEEHLTISDEFRDQFPVSENLVYLNHAAVAPLVKPAAEAMSSLARDACQFGSFHYDKWLQTYEKLRVSAARLIHAHRDEIAIVKNTSEGIATIALGIDWKPGDRIVAFEEEFPANYYCWQRLQSKGVVVTWLRIADPLQVIDDACRGARLLAVSYVNYLSGWKVDLDAIGEICNRYGTFYFVDAIQGLGALPLDVRKSRIHALAADGHKWLLGPEGCGVLYVQKDMQDLVEPVEFGWTNVAAYADYTSRDMTLRPDAGRYEPGTLNTIGIFGLQAAIEFMNEVGIERISPQVLALASQIKDGVEAKGYEVLPTGSAIVSFRKEGIDSRMIHAMLRENKIITAPRQGWVRTSPHFYISPAAIDKMIDLLP